MYEPAKRLLDLIFATIVFIIFSPVFLIAPILIKLDSPGSIFFRHRRVGKNKKIFYMYKFRTMIDNADDLLKKNKNLMAKFKKGSGWKFETQDDPRITKIGKFLRNYSLDELPQLINIFKGEMSMVGPRAYRNDDLGNEIEEQLKLFPKLRNKMDQVLTIKPGLTGPWQTSGRNILPWDERVKLDAKYAGKKSLLNDIWLILKTPFAMISKW